MYMEGKGVYEESRAYNTASMRSLYDLYRSCYAARLSGSGVCTGARGIYKEGLPGPKFLVFRKFNQNNIVSSLVLALSFDEVKINNTNLYA